MVACTTFFSEATRAMLCLVSMMVDCGLHSWFLYHGNFSSIMNYIFRMQIDCCLIFFWCYYGIDLLIHFTN